MLPIQFDFFDFGYILSRNMKFALTEPDLKVHKTSLTLCPF